MPTDTSPTGEYQELPGDSNAVGGRPGDSHLTHQGAARAVSSTSSPNGSPNRGATDSNNNDSNSQNNSNARTGGRQPYLGLGATNPSSNPSPSDNASNTNRTENTENTGTRTLLLPAITQNDVRGLSISGPDGVQFARRRGHTSLLRKSCEWLVLLGALHLALFPDWWNGVTDIIMALFLSTALFRSTSLTNLVSVVLIASLNGLVQLFALVQLCRVEAYERDYIDKHGGNSYFIAYILLIFCDFIVMITTANAAKNLLKDVYEIIVARQDEEDGVTPDLENSLINRGPREPVNNRPIAFPGASNNPQAGGQATLTPFAGPAFKLPE